MTQQPPEAPWSLARPDAGRSLILCALGAIVGLVVAGFGLFTAQGTRTSAIPPEDIATVNQVPILTSDYIAQIRSLYDVPLGRATAAQKRQVLSDMIREELYVQRGVELGMQADTIEIRQALVGAVEAQAAADAASAQPTETDLRAYHVAHRARYAGEGTMTLDDYLLPAKADARAAVADLRAAGTTPAILARHGLKRSARMTDGEEFYFAAKIHLGARLFAAARVLPASGVSDPVDLADGRHILVMRTNTVPPAPAFEDVRDRVLTDYIAAQQASLLAGNERFLRKRADIQIRQGYQ